MSTPRDIIEQNLEDLKQRVADACERAGRDPADIKLVAVTKTVGTEETRALYALGVRDFGENRCQEAVRKMDELTDLEDINWHLIGHLQRNKAKVAVKLFEMIHSLDSLDIAQTIDKHAGAEGKKSKVLIQVNVSGEESKSGLDPDEAPPLMEKLSVLQNIEVQGLMTMAPFVDDPEIVRPCFQKLRELRDKIAEQNIANISMPHLSMGMTQDFEAAIEEGANIIRVGSAIFRGLR